MINERQKEILGILYQNGRASVAELSRTLFVSEMTVRRDLTEMEKGGFLRRQLVVTGTKGTIELKPFEVGCGPLQYTDKSESFDTAWHVPGRIARSELFDRYDAMMASFAAMVRGEKENPWTPDYELELFRTVLKACGA